MACHLWFEKGAIGALHSHVHVQTTYILKGKFEFTIAGEKRIVVPGDALYKETHFLHIKLLLMKKTAQATIISRSMAGKTLMKT